MSRNLEIERKFLVREQRLPLLPPGSLLAQGYLSFFPTVRVRTQQDPDGSQQAFLTIKGEGLISRDEFEYAIPYAEGVALLNLAQSRVVTKTRHHLPAGNSSLFWEIDRFSGENEGLIVAEIELPDADHPFERPDWLGEDVTENPAYKNLALSRHPFRDWDAATHPAKEPDEN